MLFPWESADPIEIREVTFQKRLREIGARAALTVDGELLNIRSDRSNSMAFLC